MLAEKCLILIKFLISHINRDRKDLKYIRVRYLNIIQTVNIHSHRLEYYYVKDY
jgi:hypothetical protein